jgi:GrpB-like predicted nucleotidyltransferase (UPF0157 family)
MPIEVVPYDRAWPQRFAEVRHGLRAALRGVPTVTIEHVGSTSVPGLAAKPVIDMDVIVIRPQVERAIAAMERAGYTSRGDLGIPDRYSMAEPGDGLRRNVYVVLDGSLALRNHLAVRDALRADAQACSEYARLKRSLAAGVAEIDAYVVGKTALLLGILERSGFSIEELSAVRDANRA